MLLDNLRLFMTIAEKGSLVAAARETGMSTTTVSERLAALEGHYGVVLFNRTTRSISLTEEGRTLIHGARSVLSEVADLDTLIRHGAETLSGLIRVSAPVDLGRGIVSKAISSFTAENPAVSIELSLSDGYVDLVGRGFDMAVRFGNVIDSSLRLRSLGHFQRLICAAPEYLEKHGAPRIPEDLTDHNCLVMRFGDSLDNVWEFGTGQKRKRIPVRGNRVVNDGWLIRCWGSDRTRYHLEVGIGCGRRHPMRRFDAFALRAFAAAKPVADAIPTRQSTTPTRKSLCRTFSSHYPRNTYQVLRLNWLCARVGMHCEGLPGSPFTSLGKNGYYTNLAIAVAI